MEGYPDKRISVVPVSELLAEASADYVEQAPTVEIEGYPDKRIWAAPNYAWLDSGAVEEAL